MFNHNVRVSMCITTINIAAILDLNTVSGRAAKWSLHLALNHLNGTMNDTSLNLTIQESGGDVGNVLQVFRSEAVAILVQNPKMLKFMAPIAEAVDVPILSLGGTASGSRYSISTVPSNYDDMKAIAAMVAYFQWKEVIVLYEDEEFWLSGVNALREALEQQGGKKIYQAAALSSQEDQVRKTLQELTNTSCVRAFIVYTSVDVALNMFSIAHKLEMITEGYAWVVTDSIASSVNSLNSSSFNTMQGIVGVKRLLTPQSTELREKLKLDSSDDGVNRIGIQAYTSLKLVANAISSLISQNKTVEYNGEIPDTDFPASMKVLTGGKLLIQKTNSLKSDAEIHDYEIINVVGEKSYRKIGLWKNEKGRLQSIRKETDKLGAIIWPPGDTAQTPNGYRRIVVGKIVGNWTSNFNEFIGLLSGYTNDTFEAAVKALPYNLPFVYEAFDKGHSTLSNYDAFVTELIDGKPYSQTGLVMMVPITKVRGKTRIFFRPFTAGLWAVSGAFFLFTAFLVWLMEHSDNEEFSGNISQQVITSLTLSLSAFVFAYKEDVKSAMGKGIVATWLFIALILNNSYTAHLTSILTVEKLAPALTNMNSLTTSEVKVGYMNNSFARDYLMHDLNIPKERLVPLNSPQDYVEKLRSGEVGAIVDENPYVQIVKSLYPCAKIAVVDRGFFDTGGLGFFFRKGSPFLADISEGVLNISEKHNVVESIRSKWFGQRTSCPELDSGVESNTSAISPAHLWTLFVFTASVYAITALIHIGRKLHQRRDRGINC
ncbi:hypothetical protein KI387_015378 [Taxus chinensis]|uniref:Ionotropic glutamate receptor C-terminal domain-containing protein n=1 Tax=Taxus chinensis TaxID=29808 RepID=A0AA38GCI8_TAXCH|nr:hypothetical protein KI387_015378 [Taxus chinensis]